VLAVPVKVQVPGLALQFWHAPAHPVWQQNPSTQKLLAHWVLRLQTELGASVGTQAPALQYLPLPQSGSVAQLPQPVPVHTPLHVCVGGTGATQLPFLHDEGKVTAPPEQL